MQNVSGYGLRGNLVASRTFPNGFDLSEFADDADPLDFPNKKIADGKSNLNGGLVIWTIAGPTMVTISVIPGSEDDQNLAILFAANNPGAGKRPVGDVCQLTMIYPDGSQKQATNGAIVEGPPGTGVASSGRQKSKTYSFMFENDTGS